MLYYMTALKTEQYVVKVDASSPEEARELAEAKQGERSEGSIDKYLFMNIVEAKDDATYLKEMSK